MPPEVDCGALEVSRPDVPDSVSPEVPHQSRPMSLPSFEPLTWPMTKISTLFGAQKFSQLEDALELHDRRSQRWGGGYEIFGRDFTPRSLYSKH